MLLVCISDCLTSVLRYKFSILDTLEYAIRRVQVIQDGLKLNGSHQLLGYADYVNILGGNVHTIKENAKALVVAIGDWTRSKC
jgi:hypothetical protein